MKVAHRCRTPAESSFCLNFFFQLAKRKERREEAQKGLAQAEEAGELTYPAGNSVKHLLGSMIRSQDHGQWNGHQWILVISSWKFK